MAHKFQPGDEFKLDPKWFGKCRAKNKKYIIDHISKYGNLVYYIDSRTNIKCKCSQCSQGIHNRWGGYDPTLEKNPQLKSIAMGYIILTQSKFQRNRDISLKVLFGKEKNESDKMTIKEFREKYKNEVLKMKEPEVIYNWNLYLDDPDNFKIVYLK